MKPSECRLRPVTNDDADLVIQLIDNVYREYGETMHLEQADRDLQNLQGAYMERGGSFVVLEQDHEIVGCHATLPVDPAAKLGTLRRLYLAPKLRGQGWGDLLMNWALDWA
ncbi:MAG: GNAT family N-acetyltransferase, partial [Planctomycetota bacterium]|nr:GNAT family N-acetyltransferase [Planctomycetota bacterium]